MFRCDVCGKVTQPREKLHKWVQEYRVRSSDGGKEPRKELNLCTACWEQRSGQLVEPSPQALTSSVRKFEQQGGHDAVCMYCGGLTACTDVDCLLSCMHETVCEDCLRLERDRN